MKYIMIICVFGMVAQSCKVRKYPVYTMELKSGELIYSHSVRAGNDTLTVMKLKNKARIKTPDFSGAVIDIEFAKVNVDTLAYSIATGSGLDNKNKKDILLWPHGLSIVDFHVKNGNDCQRILNAIPEKYRGPRATCPNGIDLNQITKNSDGSDKEFKFETIKYVENERGYQSLSVPFKYRRGLEGVPYRIETGVNLGVGYAIMKNKTHTYRPITLNGKPDSYEYRVFQKSVIPFVGATTVALDSITTRGVITKDRTVFGGTAGVMLSAGFNKVDIGVVIGVDQAIGRQSSSWVYNRVVWIGFGLGVSLTGS